MIAYNDPLWQALQAFELDGANAELSFTQRLARENRWHHAYAEQVVVEYKKFLWLAMRAVHPVTPSEEVDQAWHLHLVYTESYWNDLCGKVLGRPLHHGPTKGGFEEDEKFHDWYARTLASYEEAFGTPPPVAVWPPPGKRFDDRARFQRVDTAGYWMISKNLLRSGVRLGGLAAGAAIVAAVVVNRDPQFTVVERILAADMFLVFVIILGAVAVGSAIASNRKKDRNRRRDGSGCSSHGCGGTGCGGSSSSSSNDDGGSSGCGSSGCGGGGCGGGGD